jgi:oligoendopeptidase F
MTSDFFAAMSYSQRNSASGSTASSMQGDPGPMPRWNLADLYPSADSPELNQDLQKATADADSFAARYQGKLDAISTNEGPAGLYSCLKEFEALQDRLGRIGSFAFLNYVTKVDDPARAKFFGDVQEKLTNIGAKLLFLSLEINRLDDALIERLMTEPPLDHFRPWLTEVRKE